MNDWYYINMYTLPNEIFITVYTDKTNIHNTKIEVQHHHKNKNLLLEGSKMFSKISQIIFPDKVSQFFLEDTLYYEISQEEINKYLECTWYNQATC